MKNNQTVFHGENTLYELSLLIDNYPITLASVEVVANSKKFDWVYQTKHGTLISVNPTQGTPSPSIKEKLKLLEYVSVEFNEWLMDKDKKCIDKAIEIYKTFL